LLKHWNPHPDGEWGRVADPDKFIEFIRRHPGNGNGIPVLWRKRGCVLYGEILHGYDDKSFVATFDNRTETRILLNYALGNLVVQMNGSPMGNGLAKPANRPAPKMTAKTPGNNRTPGPTGRWVEPERAPKLPLEAEDNNTVEVLRRVEYYARMAGVLHLLKGPSSPLKAVWYSWIEGHQYPVPGHFEQTLERFFNVLRWAKALRWLTVIQLRTERPFLEMKAFLIAISPGLAVGKRMKAWRQLDGKSLHTVAAAMIAAIKKENPKFKSTVKGFAQELRRIEDGESLGNTRRSSKGGHPIEGFRRPSYWPLFIRIINCEDPFLIVAGFPEQAALERFRSLDGQEWFKRVRLAFGKTSDDMCSILGVGRQVMKRWNKSGPEGLSPAEVVAAIRKELTPVEIRARVEAAWSARKTRPRSPTQSQAAGRAA
jgi:hypothetical protein